MAQAMICDGCDAAPGLVLVTYVEEGDVKAYCPPCFGDMCRALASALDAVEADTTAAVDPPPASQDPGSPDTPTSADSAPPATSEGPTADAVAAVLAAPVDETV